MKKNVVFYLCEKDMFPNLVALNHRLNAVFNGESMPVMVELEIEPNFPYTIIAFCSEVIEEKLLEFKYKKHINDDGFFWMDISSNDTPRLMTYEID
jgi:hypothetical protein